MATTTKSTRVTDPPATSVGRVVVELTGLSNKKVRGLFDHGCVTVNGEPCSHPGQKVQAGDQVEVNYDPAQGYPIKKREWEDASFSVVFEDAHLIVVNKAANVLTVATDRGGDRNTLVDRVSHYLKHTGRRREALVVHRLDRGVSGLLVFAKSQRMLEALQDQFKERKPDRRYIAIVAGILERESGTYRSHLATGKALNQYSTRDESKGELAITHYRRQQQLADTTVVEVQLETGRRNQIRVQFSDHGHPVLGDPRYGVSRSQHERWPGHRIALHALSLGFVHPATGKPLRFESELPKSMRRFIDEQTSRNQ
ncbi:MAG: RluA family pseudouridine synthase [Pirellulales bacterium]